MITGDATVVGAAAIEIYPLTTGFQERVKEETAPAFGGLSKDAERAGEESGGKLSKGFSKGTSGIASTLAGLGLPLGNLGGHLSKTADGLGKVDSKGKGLTGTLSTLGGGTLALATAGVVGFGVAGVVAAGKYESATTSIASNANISVAAAKRISDAFLNTAGHTIYSAQQIATAYGSVAGMLGALNGKALTAGQSQKFMAAAMDLAEASGVQLGAATEATAKIMQAYHLQVAQAGPATDILFNASRVTGMGLEQVTAALSRTKSKLGDLAPSLSESAGLLDALAKAGVVGRTSISVMSTAFTTLVGQGKPTTEMAKQLGLQIFDSSGKFEGMRSVISQLQPKLAGLSQEQQLAATKALFGASANKQLLDIVLKGPAAFQAQTAAVSRAGAAHAAAEKQSKTLSHQVDLLKATAVDLAIKFGNVLIPKLRELAGTISEGITWLSKHKEAAKQLAIVVTTILGVAVGVFLVNKMRAFTDSFVKAGRTLGVFAAENTATAATVETEGAAIVGSADTTAAGVDTALGATGVGLILVGLGLAATELATHWGEVMQGLEGAAKAIVGGIEAAFEAVVNTIINALNTVIRSYNETLGELTGSVPEIEKFGNAAVNKKGASGSQVNAATTGGGGVEQEILKFWTSKGFSANAAAGFVGNAAQESTLNPGAPGGGLYQQSGYPSSYGTGSVAAQSQHVLEHLPAGLKARLNKAKTPQEAANLIAKEYEKPKGSQPGEGASSGVANIKHREQVAAEALKHAKAVSGDTEALEKHIKALGHHESASKKAAGKAKAEGYVDPFTSASHLVRGREDEGIDFTASPGSKISAIGTGIINKIIPNWFKGQPLIEELLTSGPEKGKHVYYAEQINKAVREGQHVKAGQMIGTVASHGTGLELGFGAGGGRTLAQATTGYTEGQKTPAAAEFSKFLASVGKGGSQLQTASKVFETVAKAELHKQTADKKTGESTLQKMTQAIQSGGVKELSKVVGGTHDAALKNLVARLHSDHVAALDKLADKLTKVHEKALAAMARALVKLEEKQVVEKLKTADRIATQEAENTSTAIADAAKVTLDRAAEVGKAGAALAAAQAQTNADAVKAADDAAIGVAKLGVEHAAGHGELAEEAAEHGLVAAENAAKVAEANAQAALDLANNAATEAQTKATEENTKATEANTKASETTATTPGGLSIGALAINAAGMSTGEILAEFGWQVKTGGLPVAPPAAPAVAA